MLFVIKNTNMKLKTNSQTLIDEIVNQDFHEDSTFTDISNYFEYFASSMVLKNLDLSGDEILDGITGKGGDGGIDGMYVFLDDAYISEDTDSNSTAKFSKVDLYIIQAKRETSFKEDAIMKWKTVSENLLQIDTSKDYSKRYSEKIIGLFGRFSEIIKCNIRSISKIKFHYYYVTFGVEEEIHSSVMEQSEELKKIVKQKYPSSDVEIEFWGADKLMCAYRESPDIELQISFDETPISLTASDYLALVKLSDYYHFIVNDNKELRKSIFEANIRDYQGHNAVNTAISHSLHNQTDGEDFWWLNNGITIISEDIQRPLNRTIVLKNPQIVNGLQTSREIFNYFQENPNNIDSDSRNVLVRILKPESEESRDNIIFATNNQTNITQYALKVSENIHKQIELYLKNRNLYYDRRKNFYKNQNKKHYEIVSVSFLAQCLISIVLKKPDYARARPSSILSDATIYNQLYSESINIEAYYKAAYIGKTIKNTISSESEYSSVEVNDILFYVIYSVVRKVTGKLELTFEDLINVDLDTIDKDLIMTCAEKIYELYQQKGAKSSIVKSSAFVTFVDNAIFQDFNNGEQIEFEDGK